MRLPAGIWRGHRHGRSVSVRRPAVAARYVLLALVLQAFVGLPVEAAHDVSLFELDANPKDNGPAGDDWDKVYAGTDGGSTRLFLPDPPATDTTYFSSAKDIDPISGWAVGSSAPDKNELTNAYGVVYTSGGSTRVYVGADRFDTSGDAQLGFWLLQRPVAPLPNLTFSGQHEPNDLLVVIDFTNGGGISSLKAYKWAPSIPSPTSPLVQIATGGACTTAGDLVCAAVNSAGQASPWAYKPKSGPSGTFPAGAFVEIGIDVGSLLPGVCFLTLLAESRSSQQLTAQLKDFAFGRLSTCAANPGLAKTPDGGFATYGSPATWTLSVTNAGPGPAADVVVADTFPAGWTITSVTPSLGACTVTGSAVSCSIPYLASGGSAIVSVVATPGAAACGLSTNTATVSASNEKPSTLSDNSNAGSITVSCADVTIQKSASAATVPAGSPLTFTIVAKNNGPGSAPSVTVSDPLPAVSGGWTLGGADAGACSIAAGTLSCAFGALADGATRTVNVTTTTTTDDCGDLSNTATVGAGVNLNGTNDQATAGSHVTCADVSVTKTASSPSVVAGAVASWTLAVASHGPDAATNVVLTDTLPALSGWAVAGADAGACAIAGGVLTCSWASLPSGASKTITLSANTTASDCGDHENVATLAADLDTGAANDESSATIHVTCAGVSVSKTADAASVYGGDAVGFTLVVTSAGPDAAAAVSLSDPLPAVAGGWTLGGPDAAACAIVAGNLTCAWAALPAGATRTVTLSATTSLADCGSLVNTASVSAAVDLDPSDNADSASIGVSCADVAVAKQADEDPVDVGDDASFTLLVSNAGPDAAADVELSDTLPALAGGWTLAGADAGDCTLTGLSLACSWASLPAGALRVVTVRGATSPDDCGDLDNEATVTSRADPDGSNDAADASIHVACASVSLAKTASDATVDAGDAVSFTITVSNAGPDAALAVVVTDALPPVSGAWLLGATDGDCAIDAGVLTCEWASLSAGENRTLILTTTTSADDCGDLDNTASVTSRADVAVADNEDSASVHVTCANVAVSKAADAAAADVGGAIGFTLTVTSEGPDAALAVELTDALPTLAGAWSLDGPDAADCAIVNGTLTCSWASLAAGATRTVHVVAATTLADCGEVTNTASVTAALDLDGGDDSAQASTYVTCAAVSLDKSVSPAVLDVGGSVTFTLNVTSAGPDAAQDVLLLDELPPIASGWTLGGPDAADCSLAGDALECAWSAIPADASRVVTVTGTTGLADCGEHANDATVSARLDTSSGDDADSASYYVTCADVSVAKTGPAAVDAGDDATFTLVVTSEGPDAAEDVTLVDAPPALAGGWTIAGPDAAACGWSGATLLCAWDEIPAGETRTVVLTGATSAEDCGDLDNSATAAARLDTNGSNNASAASTHVTCADVSVTKGSAAGTIDVGDDIVFTLLVESHGPDAATGVVLSDTLPAISGSWSVGVGAADCAIANGTLACSWASIGVGASRVVTVKASTTLDDCGNVLNAASVAADVDIDGANDASSTTVHVTCADVSLAKSAAAPAVPVGANASFTLVVTSEGPDAAETVALTDVLPPLAASWAASGPDGAACSVVNGTLSCAWESIPAGATRTVVVSAPTSLADCGDLENAASVAARLDTNASNDEASASLHVTCADVSVAKSADSAKVDVGAAVGFTLTVGSHGPDAATGVVLTDTLPALAGGWTVTGAECDVSGDTLTCDLGTLEPGGSVEIRLDGQTTLDDCGDLVNSASVAADVNTNASNDVAGASIHVTCANAGLVKSSPARVPVGAAIEFDITVAAYGPDPSENVTLTDVVPTVGGGWALEGDDAEDCTFDGSTLSCDFGTLAAGEYRYVELVATTTLADCAGVTNTASISSRLDTDPDEDAATSSTEVVCADVSVRKTASAPLVWAGDVLTYTLVVASHGPDDAEDATLTDLLPAFVGTWALSGPDAAACSIAGGVLSCAWELIPAGENRTVQASIVPQQYEDCGPATNAALAGAWVDTNATNNVAGAEVFVDCVWQCTRTIGYWKNHPSAWPVAYLHLGGKNYTKAELLTVLQSKTLGDASIILGKQLIATKLNLAAYTEPYPITSTVADADAALAPYAGKLPYKVKASTPAGATMTSLGATLDGYNNGLLTVAGHCS